MTDERDHLMLAEMLATTELPLGSTVEQAPVMLSQRAAAHALIDIAKSLRVIANLNPAKQTYMGSQPPDPTWEPAEG